MILVIVCVQKIAIQVKHFNSTFPEFALDYYHRLVGRMVSALDPSTNIFPRMDWRFKEFPNEGTHCLYVTCVELMTLPDKPSVVGELLIDVILEGHSHISPDRLPDWINALGLILSNLPEAYSITLIHMFKSDRNRLKVNL